MSSGLLLTGHSAERREAAQAQDGCQLLAEYLGAYFRSPAFVQHWQNGGMLLALQETAGTEIVGAAFIAPASAEKWQKFSRYAPLPAGLTAVNLNGLAVTLEKRNRGYGWLLTVKRLQLARAAGYQLAIAESWLQSAAPSAPVLQKAGLEQVAVVEQFWNKDYPDPGTCPRCGDYCYCTARLFAGKL